MGHFDKFMAEVQPEAEKARRVLAEQESSSQARAEREDAIERITEEFLSRIGSQGLKAFPQCRTEDVGQIWVNHWSGWAIDTNVGKRYLHSDSKSWYRDTTTPGWTCWQPCSMEDVDPDGLARSLAVILATYRV